MSVHVAVQPLIALIAQALFVKIEAPDGQRVTREQAPILWADVDALTKELNAPKIHDIVIDMDTNAGAQQRPTLGIFGRYRNTLLLGLPLMEMLPKDEMRAMMAHERRRAAREEQLARREAPERRKETTPRETPSDAPSGAPQIVAGPNRFVGLANLSQLDVQRRGKSLREDSAYGQFGVTLGKPIEN